MGGKRRKADHFPHPRVVATDHLKWRGRNLHRRAGGEEQSSNKPAGMRNNDTRLSTRAYHVTGDTPNAAIDSQPLTRQNIRRQNSIAVVVVVITSRS